MSEQDGHVSRNRDAWAGWAADYAESGRQAWASEPHWGVWRVPDSDLRALPGVVGLDVVELGCGTGYVSSWLARRGARRVVGIDLTRAQLATARSLQQEFDLRFPLVRGDAERLPFADQSFDVAVSEYGASIWCDPYRWIPEAARVLRSGGRLVFLVNGTLLMLCLPDETDGVVGRTLLRPYFDMHRFEWSDDPSVEFHLGYGEMIRLLRRSGFVVEDLVEVRAPEGATTRYGYQDPVWARQWPSEEIWVARKAD